MSWSQADGRWRTEILRPVDLRTRDHEEYLYAETAEGKTLQVRLDRISKAESL
jgi:transcriptional antiterminator Rof (Rho-off)